MIAQLVARVVRDTRAATAPAEQEARKRGTEAMMDSWEGEIGQFAADLVGKMAAGEDPHPTLKAMVERGENPTHQTDFILSLIVGFAGAFTLISEGGGIVWQNTINDLRKANRYVGLSAPDAADGVERSRWSMEEGDAWAAESAVSSTAFQAMVDLVGEPPPLDEMRSLLVQGRLDPLTFQTMYRYSRMRNDWLDQYQEGHYRPLSGADIVEAYIKGNIGESEASDRYGVGGGRPEDFPLASLTAGEAIGTESALNLFNHDLISEAEVKSVIRYSRINPRFEAIAELQRHHYLPAFQIVRMLTAGTATAEQATTWLLQDGYPADQVGALVSGATVTKVTKHKDAAESVVLDSYTAGMISGAQALAALADLGYVGAEAALILQSVDARRTITLQTQATAAVRKAYLAGKLTAAQASGDLDSIGVHPTVRDHEIAAWNVEKATEFRELTPAQIGTLVKDGIVSARWAIGRWQAMGYDPAEAVLLSYLHGNPVPAGGTGL